MANWFHTPEFSVNLDLASYVTRVGVQLLLHTTAPGGSGHQILQIPNELERDLIKAIGRKEMFGATVPQKKIKKWGGIVNAKQ